MEDLSKIPAGKNMGRSPAGEEGYREWKKGSSVQWALRGIDSGRHVNEVQPSFENSLQNLQIGILYRQSQENYTFSVGYHALTGAKVTLPMLVLKMIKLQNEEEMDERDINSLRVELDVIGIIRYKILFKSKPKALISKPQIWILIPSVS
ncbi:Chromosome transmission fidelity protein 8 [Forsythia ovata]|uniref:Chromosome transmission fidelity protein 8 n=1 Tax=Forsythia ovata TaxID=205694 RepID=A0ABD1T2Y2_9LAMI